MNLKSRIQEIGSKKLIGKKVVMSFADNKTQQLWQGFMPYKGNIKFRLNNDLICLQVYNALPQLENFDPTATFQKWALAEVYEISEVPDGMEIFELPGGLYAVFDYKGRAIDFGPTFRYILGEWLPQSDYEIDDRPHFEVLGTKYKNNDPESEEEIWIPVKPKQ
ncbi:AraC family transcriptional regulator [Mucilaginibacter conchicola]|uniref:AraC family transcriptional regulator n=1 Tax=Mucilaginibacter conchicola TaxID=2303333 RepID=A0A372NUF2_9SPHI|nr:GyrI-like domain-containing protein [Mucilaginibacter conchicola]RFZ92644.1 AraC family transcriptional regulator [Mucilaginibacter conchicola]